MAREMGKEVLSGLAGSRHGGGGTNPQPTGYAVPGACGEASARAGRLIFCLVFVDRVAATGVARRRPWWLCSVLRRMSRAGWPWKGPLWNGRLSWESPAVDCEALCFATCHASSREVALARFPKTCSRDAFGILVAMTEPAIDETLATVAMAPKDGDGKGAKG